MRLIAGIFIAMLTACGASDDKIVKSVAVEITETNTTPTVDIPEYTLIQPEGANLESDAEAIMKVKRAWPLAMQSVKREDFEAILGRNFTFTDGGKIMNREEYIVNRTKPSDWKITFVRYENVTLQFFGDVGVLSYKNLVTNKQDKTAKVEVEEIHWTDVYEKENGQWKLSAAIVTDFKIQE